MSSRQQLKRTNVDSSLGSDDSSNKKLCANTEQSQSHEDLLITQVLHGTGLCGVLVAEICSFVDGFVRASQSAVTSDCPQTMAVSVPLTSAPNIPHSLKLCLVHPNCGAVTKSACVMDAIMDRNLALAGDRTALYLVYACIGAWLEGPTTDMVAESLPTLLFSVNSVKNNEGFLADISSELVRRRPDGVKISHKDDIFAYAHRHMDKAHCWLAVFAAVPEYYYENSLLLSIISREPVSMCVKYALPRHVSCFISKGALLCRKRNVTHSSDRAYLARRCVIITEHASAVAIPQDKTFYDALYQKTQCTWAQMRAWLNAHPHHPRITLQSLCQSVPFFLQSAHAFLANEQAPAIE